MGPETGVLCQLSRGAVQLEQPLPCTPSECLTRITGRECSRTLKRCHVFKWQAAFSPSSLGYSDTKRIQTKMGVMPAQSDSGRMSTVRETNSKHYQTRMDCHLVMGKQYTELGP